LLHYRNCSARDNAAEKEEKTVMNLLLRAGATALLGAMVCLAGAAGAAPVGTTSHDSAVQQVDYRGGPKGEWLPDWGPGAYAYAGAGYDYNYAPGYYRYGYGPSYYSYGYDPGYYSYTYEPGYYSYGYDPGYYSYGFSGYGYPQRDTAYCMSHFRSYDPASGTYLGFDGLRHSCP
jgi:hypothetical protein